MTPNRLPLYLLGFLLLCSFTGEPDYSKPLEDILFDRGGHYFLIHEGPGGGKVC